MIRWLPWVLLGVCVVGVIIGIVVGHVLAALGILFIVAVITLCAVVFFDVMEHGI